MLSQQSTLHLQHIELDLVLIQLQHQPSNRHTRHLLESRPVTLSGYVTAMMSWSREGTLAELSSEAVEFDIIILFFL